MSVIDSTSEIQVVVVEIQLEVNQLILESENESKYIRTGVELIHQARDHINSLLSFAKSTNKAMKNFSKRPYMRKKQHNKFSPL